MALELAVVIITKNLEWNIRRVLDSVFAEVPAGTDVVLVDSASTDRTVDLALASRHPVTIVRLAGDQRLTAAAGRFTGQQHTDSPYILFLDGDVELIPGFAGRALEVLRSNPTIGAVGGKQINVPKVGRTPASEAKLRFGTSFAEVPFAGGTGAMYRRSALEEAGSFAIDVFSDEEPALGVRLRHAGHRIVQLDHSSVFHHTDPMDAVSTLWRRRGRNLWIGHGQNIRAFMGTPMLSTYLRERGHGIAPAIVILAVLATVAMSLVTRDGTWVALGLGALVIGFAALVAAKGSVGKAIYTIVKRMLILEGTIEGLRQRPLPRSEYRLRSEIADRPSAESLGDEGHRTMTDSSDVSRS